MVARANIPSRSEASRSSEMRARAELRAVIDRRRHQTNPPGQLATVLDQHTGGLSGSELRHVDARNFSLELDLVVDRDTEQRLVLHG